MKVIDRVPHEKVVMAWDEKPVPGRGGYPAPFDERGRPLDSRRRNSPPPRQYAERGRGGPRMRGGRG